MLTRLLLFSLISFPLFGQQFEERFEVFIPDSAVASHTPETTLIFFTADPDGRVVPLEFGTNDTQRIVTLLHESVAEKVIVYFPKGARYSDFDSGRTQFGFKEAYNTFEHYVKVVR
jgi:hypothetical protein